MSTRVVGRFEKTVCLGSLEIGSIRCEQSARVLIALPANLGNIMGMRVQLGSVGAGLLLIVAASCSSGENGGGPGGSAGSLGAGGSSMAGAGGSSSSCAAAQLMCGTTCVSPATDNLNCGACGKTCGAGQSCMGSMCQCTGNLKACGASCVNTMTDGSNCGMCGNACPAGKVCSQGACSDMCAGGVEACGNSCPDKTTDPSNCGFCGNACAAGQSCSNSACSCAAGQGTCNGACVDLMTSATNCGACGKACSGGQACSNGVCGGGGGGSGGSGGSGGGSAGVCAKPGAVANFEEGMGMPQAIKQESRTGEFEMFNDKTSTNETMTVEASGGTADCDKWALHVKGSGYKDWGAGVGLSLSGTAAAPMVYNATTAGFTGVRFKAKLGTGHDMKSPVRFNISTPFTESKDNAGGQCDPAKFPQTTTKAERVCYQHPGRFLGIGAGAGQLSQNWQTFTYCFDRDLYPLSLPSNMTQDQRNNVGASMLKLQFQFNKAKDYTVPYTTTWPPVDNKVGLPFDFWLDDVEFIKGDCPNMVMSPSNNTPAKAFPQKSATIGTCMTSPNGAKFSQALVDAYAVWQKNFVQTDKVVAPEQQGAITSEALAYGMMIAAAFGDKTLFDKFHGYVKANGGTGSGLMTWKNGASGSASDADIDIAYALYMAHLQWPSGGYKAAADAMASAVASQDLVSNIVRGGSQFKDAPFNASYFIPNAFRVFAANGATSFTAAISANYALVNANVAASAARVPTDWADASSGNPSSSPAQVTSDIQDGGNGAMGYDAARVPWRLGLDACFGGDTTALKKIVDNFSAKYDMGATIDLMKAGWLKAKDEPHTKAQNSQASYIGPIGVGAMATGNAVMRDRALQAVMDILESGDFNHTYYPTTVGLITALIMTGNFPTP